MSRYIEFTSSGGGRLWSQALGDCSTNNYTTLGPGLLSRSVHNMIHLSVFLLVPALQSYYRSIGAGANADTCIRYLLM